MNRFIISEDVANLLPRMQVVVVTARNIDNSPPNDNVAAYSKSAAESALSSLSAYPNAQSHPRIALYRNTLKEAANVSAKKFPQSNESLYKRLLKEQGPLRPINPLVDFYNSVSIRFGVTAGAFCLSDLGSKGEEPLELRLSREGDTFLALDAGEGAAPAEVAEKELVYAQEGTVLTRHLAWRQAAQGLVTERTSDVVFVSEVFNEQESDKPTDLAKTVASELLDGLSENFGAEGSVTILGKGLGRLSAEL